MQDKHPFTTNLPSVSQLNYSTSSPRFSKPTKSDIAHKTTEPEKELKQKSLISGTTMENLMRALKTYQNNVGPGQYHQPSLTGRNTQISGIKNVPSFSIGSPLQIHVNPETRNMIATKFKTPSPNQYDIPTDNLYFKKVMIAQIKEKKFFEPVNMPSIRARVPVQYSSIEGIPSEALVEKGLRLANYQGGSQAASYRRVGIGFGERVDFTKIGGAKADFIHDYEKMYTMKNQIRLNKARSSKKKDTFGSHWDAYKKVVVPGGASQYLGQATEN